MLRGPGTAGPVSRSGGERAPDPVRSEDEDPVGRAEAQGAHVRRVADAGPAPLAAAERPGDRDLTEQLRRVSLNEKQKYLPQLTETARDSHSRASS